LISRVVEQRLGVGVVCALGAGLLWGLVFVAPLWLHDYPAMILSAGRYVAFGLLALPLAWLDRKAIARLTRADWREATKLSLIGNLVYYAFLAAAIQKAGAPLPTMIIGTLPVVIAICSNISSPQLRWRSLFWPLSLMALGIALVNREEWRTVTETSLNIWVVGTLLAIGALICWTWYPIRNARWLREHPELTSSTWATAQGLSTLPLALLAIALLYCLERPLGLNAVAYDWPLGPRPLMFVAVMLAIGLFASWLGTLLWNRASQLTPTALAGQLIIFETLAALLYAFLLRQEWPTAGVWVGIACLVVGVSLAIRNFDSARLS
jgi:drug/metabolite transporter (DMT)-like permease